MPIKIATTHPLNLYRTLHTRLNLSKNQQLASALPSLLASFALIITASCSYCFYRRFFEKHKVIAAAPSFITIDTSLSSKPYSSFIRVLAERECFPISTNSFKAFIATIQARECKKGYLALVKSENHQFFEEVPYTSLLMKEAFASGKTPLDPQTRNPIKAISVIEVNFESGNAVLSVCREVTCDSQSIHQLLPYLIHETKEESNSSSSSLECIIYLGCLAIENTPSIVVNLIDQIESLGLSTKLKQRFYNEVVEICDDRESPEENILMLNTIASKYPENHQVFFMLSREYLSLSPPNTKLSIESARNAIRICKSTPSPPTNFSYYFQLSRALISSQNIESLNEAQRILSVFINSSIALERQEALYLTARALIHPPQEEDKVKQGIAILTDLKYSLPKGIDPSLHYSCNLLLLKAYLRFPTSETLAEYRHLFNEEVCIDHSFSQAVVEISIRYWLVVAKQFSRNRQEACLAIMEVKQKLNLYKLLSHNHELKPTVQQLEQSYFSLMNVIVRSFLDECLEKAGEQNTVELLDQAITPLESVQNLDNWDITKALIKLYLKKADLITNVGDSIDTINKASALLSSYILILGFDHEDLIETQDLFHKESRRINMRHIESLRDHPLSKPEERECFLDINSFSSSEDEA
ncbi:MAG: hypothetical protein GWP59_01480 [Chlamydiales bacterium]|nr:hypothetical protein [Chlamydiales bacterium]